MRRSRRPLADDGVFGAVLSAAAHCTTLEAMEKRYQVFVSSTFTDLIEERRAVMQALLELDSIPAGMELFPAADEDAWTLIQQVIDDCDYYLVILAGRYGSMDAAGVSYTEKEYDYAVAAGKPVLAFLHGDPESIPVRFTDRDPQVQAKLAAFRAKVRSTKHCRFWTSADELGTAVTTSYARLIKAHPAEGWIRSRYMKTAEDAEKMARLLEQVHTLEKELEALRRLGVAETRGLAQGADPVRLEFEGDQDETVSVDTTWNDVFAVVGQACLHLPDQEQVGSALSRHWEETEHGRPTSRCLEMIQAQFFCLGLIRFASRLQHGYAMPAPGGGFERPEYVAVLWELTEYGRFQLGELIGVRRPAA